MAAALARGAIQLSSLGRRQSKLPRWVIALGALDLVIVAFAGIFGPFHNEDLADGVVWNAQYTLRALLNGHLPAWNAQVGLGIPVTHAQDLAFHPLAFGYLLLPIPIVTLAIQAAQLVVGQIYVYRLCRLLAIERGPSALAVLSFTLSEPALDYLLYNSWPTITVGWSLLPALFFHTMSFFLRHGRSDRLWALAMLALVGAFILYNGYAPFTLGAFLALAFFSLVQIATTSARVRAFVILGAVATVIAFIGGDKIVALLEELARSPADLPRNTSKSYTYALYTDVLWQLLFRPIVLPDLAEVWSNASSRGPRAVSLFWDSFVARNVEWQAWAPYFGVPFSWLALWAILSRRLGWVGAPAFAATFVVFLVLMIPPSRLLGPIGTVIGGTASFKDPVVLCGIVLAAGTLSQLRGAGPAGWRLPREISTFQVIALVLTFIPALYVVGLKSEYIRITGRAVHPVTEYVLEPGSAATLRDRIGPGARVGLYRSPVRQTQFLHAGLWVFDVGLKGVTLDDLSRSETKMYALIPEEALAHRPLLDVAGIAYIVTGAGERPTAGLTPAFSISLPEGSLDVLRNERAWGMASFVVGLPRASDLPRRQGCDIPGFLCADLTTVSALEHEDATWEEQDGDLIVRMSPSGVDRMLLVTQLHRPGWSVRCDRPGCAISPALDVLIGVHVPAGAREARLSYQPFERVIARALGAAGLASIGLALLLSARWRRRFT